MLHKLLFLITNNMFSSMMLYLIDLLASHGINFYKICLSKILVTKTGDCSNNRFEQLFYLLSLSRGKIKRWFLCFTMNTFWERRSYFFFQHKSNTLDTL